MKKSFLFTLVIALLTVFAVACGTDSKSEEPVAEEATEGADPEAEVAEETEVTIKHELGEAIVPKNPSSVVVLDMGVLDSMDKLGIEGVTGVPTQSVPDYLPKYTGEEYKNIGSLKEPDFEAIYDLKPDLIIMSGRQLDAFEELNEIAPTIFMGIDTENYVESFHHNVETLGKIFGKEEVAEEELAAIKESLSKLNEKAASSEAKGLIVLANEGALSAYGPGSRFGILHDGFGVAAVDENLEVSTHGQNISFEYIVEKDPDYLFVVDRGAVVAGGEAIAKETVENELIQGTKAYKNGNIVYLDPVYWYISAGGLTSVAGMIEEVDAAIK
ncbi:siderophore ABC transporter substrate-binding protein [bacterium LRH843]|nr:siderophore ABC transporter substrate-binding protein [bacterium LRH843]